MLAGCGKKIIGGKAHGSCCSWICLDAASILTVADCRVGKCDVRYGIVTFPSHRSNAQSAADIYISESFSGESMDSTYCPPEQVIPVTVTFVPLVTATQSSWFLTTVLERTMLVVEEMSNPSELCAAGSPELIALGASPAELSRVRPVIVKSVQPVMSKQWTGQFIMFRFLTVLLTILSRTMKWSGLFPLLVLHHVMERGKRYLEVPPFDPCPSQ